MTLATETPPRSSCHESYHSLRTLYQRRFGEGDVRPRRRRRSTKTPDPFLFACLIPMGLLGVRKGFGNHEFTPLTTASSYAAGHLGFGQHPHGQETWIHDQNVPPRISRGYKQQTLVKSCLGQQCSRPLLSPSMEVIGYFAAEEGDFTGASCIPNVPSYEYGVDNLTLRLLYSPRGSTSAY